MMLLSVLLTKMVARISYYAALVLVTGIAVVALNSSPTLAESHHSASEESHESSKKSQQSTKKQAEEHSHRSAPKSHSLKDTPTPRRHTDLPTINKLSQQHNPVLLTAMSAEVATPSVEPPVTAAAKEWTNTLTQHIRPTLQNGEPPLQEVQSYFTSSLSKAIKSLSVETPSSDEVDIRPIITSSIILFLTLSSVAGLFYISNRNGTLAIGRFNFTRFIITYDLVQMASFVIAAVCFSVVAVYLVFSGI